MPNHIQNRLQIIGNDKEVKNVMQSISSTNDTGEKVQIDFNKIKPMPQGLDAQPHSGIETWVKICTGQLDFKSMLRNAASQKSFGDVWVNDTNKDAGFKNMIGYMETSTAFETLLGERDRKNVKDFDEEDFNTFIQCLKNYRQYGNVSWYNWSIDNWGTKWNAYSQNDARNTEDTIYFQTAWSAPINLIILLSSQFPNVEFQLDYADEDSGSNTGRITIQNGEPVEINQPDSQSEESYDIYFELNPDTKDNYKLVNGRYEYIDSE